MMSLSTSSYAAVAAPTEPIASVTSEHTMTVVFGNIEDAFCKRSLVTVGTGSFLSSRPNQICRFT